MQTPNKTPTFIIPNPTPGTDFLNPNNILLADGQFAVAGSSTQIITAGGFNLNLAQGDSLNNFVFSVKGYRGNFNTTLDIYAMDDTSGTPVYYQLLPSFQGFSGSNALWTLPATLFGTTWTVNQLNNIKIKLVVDGELHLDTITLSAIYTPAATTSLNYTSLTGVFQVGDTILGGTSGATATIVTDDGVSIMTVTNVSGVFQIGETITGAPSGASAVLVSPFLSGQTVCDEFVQGQRFQLAQSMTSSSTDCLVQSFLYPDGVTPIQIADFYGNAMITIDQGVTGLEENARMTNIEHNYNGTGYVRLSFTSLNNRGLEYKYPYTSDSANIHDHSGTAEIVISNSAPFYDRFLKKCQIDALVSAPITVQDEGINKTTSLHKLNFIGKTISAVLNGLHNIDVTITSLKNYFLGNLIDDEVVKQNFTGVGVTVTQVAPGEVEINIPGGSGGSDGKVYASNADTIKNYLTNKLVVGSSLTKTILNPGVNEQIQIDNGSVVNQTGLQFEDESGNPLGTPGTVDEFEITGTGVVGTRVGNKVIYTMTAGGTGVALQTTITQVNTFNPGDVIRMASTGLYVLAQANNDINSETVGIVTSATGTDFTYVSSAITLAYANAFTPGDGLFLDPSVAGGITNVKPTTIGHIVRGLGTCLSATEIYFDISALAEEITAGGGGNGFIGTDTWMGAGVQTNDGIVVINFSRTVGGVGGQLTITDSTESINLVDDILTNVGDGMYSATFPVKIGNTIAITISTNITLGAKIIYKFN